MHLPPPSFNIFRLFLIVFLVTTTAYYLFFEQRYDAHHVYRVTVTGKKQAFVEEYLKNELDGPFDDAPLSTLCSTKTWIPGLIFKCELAQGAVGNVRNMFLNCVRYAIEAGATGFIIPEIKVRGPTATGEHKDRLVPASYFFDVPYFKNALNTACPSIQIYNHQNDLWDKPTTASPVPLPRPQLTSSIHPQADTVMLNPANWTSDFQEHLNASYTKKFSQSMPVLVSLHSPLLQWPIDFEDSAFIATFGRIFRFREDAMRLAATVLYALDQQYQLKLDPEAKGIQDGKFYGAHLRTAIDAKNAGWTNYSVQAQNYMSDAAHSGLPLIYVSSGSSSDIIKFTKEAANHTFPMEVTTRDQLLAGKGFEEEMIELAKLTWDQRDLVDYEVMLRASKVGGTWESSFSWNLAMRRHVFMGRGTWIPLEASGGVKSISSGNMEDEATPKKKKKEKEKEKGNEKEKGKEKKPSMEGKSSLRTPKLAVAAKKIKGSSTVSRATWPTRIPAPGLLKRRKRGIAQGETDLTELEANIAKTDLRPAQQSFSDPYSTVFGDVTPEEHPGVVFELALWP